MWIHGNHIKARERIITGIFEDETRRRNGAAKNQLTSTTAVTPEFLTQNLSAAIPLIKAYQ